MKITQYYRIFIFGGTGNQLFQIREAIRNIDKKVRLICLNQRTADFWSLQLAEHTNLSVRKASKIEVSIFHLCRLVFRSLGVLPAKNMSTLTRSVKIGGYHFGYFQYQDAVNLPLFLLIVNKIIAKTSNCPDTSSNIAVHIRKGDYLSKTNRKIYADISAEFILQMIAALGIPVREVDIYTDDTKWVEKHFLCSELKLNIMSEGKTALHDFISLQQYQFLILSNSTYAWWAGFLSPNVEKVVLPSKWYENQFRLDLSLITNDGWTVI